METNVMITVQPYQSYSYKPNFKGGNKNVKELSETSQALIKDILSLFESSSNDQRASIYRSKRFLDGSFIEIKPYKSYADKGINIRYMRMNQRPAEMNIGANGKIKNNNTSLDVNNIVEKYFPDIIERSIYSIA